MTVDWNKADHLEWREEFKRLKPNIPLEEIVLLDEGAKTMQDSWRLGSLHVEYERLKSKQPPILPMLKDLSI